MFTVYAKNIHTGEVFQSDDEYMTEDEAWEAIESSSYDEGESADDYVFEVEGEYEDDWYYNEDCGFDPYEGCYTYDC